jgi:hypothetical protein
VKYLKSIAQKGQSRRRCLQNTLFKTDANILSHLARQVAQRTLARVQRKTA